MKIDKHGIITELKDSSYISRREKATMASQNSAMMDSQSLAMMASHSLATMDAQSLAGMDSQSSATMDSQSSATMDSQSSAMTASKSLAMTDSQTLATIASPRSASSNFGYNGAHSAVLYEDIMCTRVSVHPFPVKCVSSNPATGMQLALWKSQTSSLATCLGSNLKHSGTRTSRSSCDRTGKELVVPCTEVHFTASMIGKSCPQWL